jgi:hypothetical protein
MEGTFRILFLYVFHRLVHGMYMYMYENCNLKVICPRCACESDMYFTEYSHVQHHSAVHVGF